MRGSKYIIKYFSASNITIFHLKSDNRLHQVLNKRGKNGIGDVGDHGAHTACECVEF
jgi:hypothetical protein